MRSSRSRRKCDQVELLKQELARICASSISLNSVSSTGNVIVLASVARRLMGEARHQAGGFLPPPTRVVDCA